jgi:CRP/FNR family transcriptional regulator
MATRSPVVDFASITLACHNCSLAELCLPFGLNGEEIDRLDRLVLRKRPLHRGDHLYRMGDAGKALYVIRTGAVKSYISTPAGDEQVVGFHLPGEVLGLDALEDEHHTCGAVALDTTTVCEVPGDRLEKLCREIPGLNRQLYRLIGKEISNDKTMLLLLGKKSAEERLATLLLSLSERSRLRGLSGTELNLCMSRQDIGNYLGLAVETISRLFARFQEEGLLRVDRRLVTLAQIDRLKKMVGIETDRTPDSF